MKLNLKKFLSTLCVVTSVSGVLAPNLVGAVNPPDGHLNYSAHVAKLPIEFFHEIYEDHYQDWYNKVMSLKNDGHIDDFSAFMLIVINQSKYFCKRCEINGIKYMCALGNWSLIIDEVRDKAKNHLDYGRIYLPETRVALELADNALIIFKNVESGEMSLGQALAELNPARVI